jgi:hypothetical protein
MVGVEDRAEDAPRVEARAAVPIDRPVGTHERNGVQVADQAVLSDGQVARPRCAPIPGGHEPPSSTSTDVARHQRASSAHFGEWQALGHDRVDLATTKQFE